MADDDFISRRAAIDFIDAGHLVNPNEPRWSDNEVVNFLRKRPSADVVEVVRCKDCKGFESTDPYEGWCHTWSDMTVDDAFCSFAERDGEQNGTD